MWLFTKTGYFSVVQDRGDADKLHVRARFREDLERLRDAYLQDLEIEHTPKADYAYRAQIDRMTFGELAIALANDVDYDNFKNAVTREQGHDRHMLYLDVWHTMVRAQNEAEQERMMRISRLYKRRGHVPGWTGVFEGDMEKQRQLDARKRATTLPPLPREKCGTLPCPECHKPAGSQHLGWCSRDVGNGQVVEGPFTIERTPGRTVSIEPVESENGELFGHFTVTRCDECEQPSGARHLEGCGHAGEYEGQTLIQGSLLPPNGYARAIMKASKKKAAKKNAKARKRVKKGGRRG